MNHLSFPIGPRDHVQGGPHATLTLVEYGDYECPYCARAEPIIAAVREHFGKQLQFAYRNFPLTEIHPHAEGAAETAEAAAAQGKFWQMHDTLYEHQAQLEVDELLELASDVGIDAGRVAAELERRVYLPRIKEDFLSGVRSGVNGTPTFFVNGVRFDDDWRDAESLIAALSGHV